MNNRLTDEQLTDIEQRAESYGSQPWQDVKSLLAEVRALQADLASHARDIAGLRLELRKRSAVGA